jgi:predicted small metal-binding protein
MAKVASCGDGGMDCDFVVHGEIEAELPRNAEAHGKAEHGMTEIPPEVIERVRSLMRDE